MTEEELKKEFNEKLKEADTKLSSSVDYYQVISEEKDSSMFDGLIETEYATTMIQPMLKEKDEHKEIEVELNELKKLLGLPFDDEANEPVRIKVTVIGRDLDQYGHPID